MSEQRERRDALLADQALAVVASADEDGPYASLVAFAAVGDGRLLFGTPRATRKFAKLAVSGRASVLIDDRSNTAVDVANAAAATAVGSVRELDDHERDEAVTVLVERHPHLSSFYASPSIAVFEVTVDTWYVVTRFQSVTSIVPESP